MDNSEINELIAKNVMHWKWDKDHVGYGWKNARGLFSAREGCWNPTTDISQAWQVIDTLSYGRTERGFKLENAYLGYWASFEFNNTWYHSGQHRTAPLAICISALKVVGVIRN